MHRLGPGPADDRPAVTAKIDLAALLTHHHVGRRLAVGQQFPVLHLAVELAEQLPAGPGEVGPVASASDLQVVLQFRHRQAELPQGQPAHRFTGRFTAGVREVDDHSGLRDTAPAVRRLELCRQLARGDAAAQGDVRRRQGEARVAAAGQVDDGARHGRPVQLVDQFDIAFRQGRPVLVDLRPHPASASSRGGVGDAVQQAAFDRQAVQHGGGDVAEHGALAQYRHGGADQGAVPGEALHGVGVEGTPSETEQFGVPDHAAHLARPDAAGS